MGEVSIAGLATELISPGPNDLIGVWDVAAGQYKKIKRQNLVGANITGGGTIATGGYTLTVPASGVAAVLNASASTANRPVRALAPGSIAGAGPFDIPYSAIADQLDLHTSFIPSGLFEIGLWIASATQSGYGKIGVIAYKSGSAFGGAALAYSTLGGTLAPVVVVSVVGGALRLTVTGNSAITALQYRIIG